MSSHAISHALSQTNINRHQPNSNKQQQSLRVYTKPTCTILSGRVTIRLASTRTSRGYRDECRQVRRDRELSRDSYSELQKKAVSYRWQEQVKCFGSCIYELHLSGCCVERVRQKFFARKRLPFTTKTCQFSNPNGLFAMSSNDYLITVAQAADLLATSSRTVARLIHTGELESLCMGRSRRIRRSAVDRFIERKQIQHREKVVKFA